jgi:hypothetical protein
MAILIEIKFRNLPKGIFHHLRNSIIKENLYFRSRRLGIPTFDTFEPWNEQFLMVELDQKMELITTQ